MVEVIEIDRQGRAYVCDQEDLGLGYDIDRFLVVVVNGLAVRGD